MCDTKMLKKIFELRRRFGMLPKSCEVLWFCLRWCRQLLIISSASSFVLFGSSCSEHHTIPIVEERKEVLVNMAFGEGFFQKIIFVRQRDFIVEEFYVDATANFYREFEVTTGIDISFYEASNDGTILPLGTIASGYWERQSEIEVNLCPDDGLVYQGK